VAIHFLVEGIYAFLREPESISSIVASISIGLVLFAAMIPVLNLWVRAMFSAFEWSRLAALYGAKRSALLQSDAEIHADHSASSFVNRIAKTEYVLEQEHREWLRLLAESEWVV